MAIPSEVVDLLICCAGVDPEKGPKLEALISKGVDWNLVIEQGQRHDILPLLYWSLKTHCPDKVPDPIMKELGEFFHANARKNLFAISELLRILVILVEQGIKAIPFKGPVLALILYGNPALRCFNCDPLNRNEKNQTLSVYSESLSDRKTNWTNCFSAINTGVAPEIRAKTN
jgi:hypothetical protein